MVKTIRKVGNGHAIPLDKAVMELLHLKEGDEVVLTVHDGALTVRPANVGMAANEVKGSIKRFRARYGSVLKRLAK